MIIQNFLQADFKKYENRDEQQIVMLQFTKVLFNLIWLINFNFYYV